MFVPRRNGPPLLLAIVALGAVTASIGCRERLDAEPSVAEVPGDPWVVAGADDDAGAALFASCASCHMADGSGRADGSIPRLAGQGAGIVIDKLERLQRGESFLPVMVPFARSLTAEDVRAVAAYVASLPTAEATAAAADGLGEMTYRSLCAACHGAAAEGNDALRAPRLCGQHAPYLVRRMAESAANLRGDADPAMAAIVTHLPEDERAAIAAWLASGDCVPEAGS